jgi:hypothetical protein
MGSPGPELCCYFKSRTGEPVPSRKGKQVTLIGLIGKAHGGREFFQPASASVRPVTVGESPLTKQQEEELQIQRFCDARKQFDPPENFDQGWRYCPNGPSLPPDFVLSSGGQPLNVEVTRYTFEPFMAAAARFEKFHKHFVGSLEGGRLNHLAGLTIRIRFLGSSQMPPRRASDVEAADVVRTLGRIIVDVAACWAFDGAAFIDGKASPPYPFCATGSTASGETEWYVEGIDPSLIGSASSPPTIEYEFPNLLVELTDVEDELNRLVRDHDNPANDELVVVTSSPRSSGALLPAETMALGWYLRTKAAAGEPLVQEPRHLRRIWHLSWPASEVTAIYQTAAEGA